MSGPARVLHERGTARCEIALRAVAEPTRPRRDIRVLRNAELRLRAVNELAIVPQCAGRTHGVDRRPSMLPQQGLRSIDRQLERLRRPGREIKVFDELLILVAADVGE